MPTAAVSAADLDLLRRYDTPTVCNVIELFDLHRRTYGYMDRRIAACYPKLPPMVGFASTATFRAADSPKAGCAYSGLAEQVESFAQSLQPPIVVIQDIDNPPVAATFGEVMCSTYKAFGAVGLIASGAGRDLDQVEALDFPCFCDGVICAHGYCYFPQINVPVHVGGMTIHPGDLLHGDRNGVTRIPVDIASAVAHGCADFMAAEAVVLDYLKSERRDAKGYARARNECREHIEALARRLKR
jgi:4-hydroxy-4-methyl-2-oxoglutarate aldolase